MQWFGMKRTHKNIYFLVLETEQEESARERALCQLTECF